MVMCPVPFTNESVDAENQFNNKPCLKMLKNILILIFVVVFFLHLFPPSLKISNIHQMHYTSLSGKYPFLLCFTNNPCFSSLCPKMLLVETGHMKVMLKAGNTADRGQIIENEAVIHPLQYYNHTINRHTV